MQHLKGHFWFLGDGDESEDEDYIPSEEWKKVVLHKCPTFTTEW